MTSQIPRAYNEGKWFMDRNEIETSLIPVLVLRLGYLDSGGCRGGGEWALLVFILSILSRWKNRERLYIRSSAHDSIGIPKLRTCSELWYSNLHTDPVLAVDEFLGTTVSYTRACSILGPAFYGCHRMIFIRNDDPVDNEKPIELFCSLLIALSSINNTRYLVLFADFAT